MTLPWARIDNNFPTNPKVLALLHAHKDRGAAAAFTYVTSVLWSTAQGKDGKIPRFALGMIHATERHADLLIEHGFWRGVDADSYEIVNFLEYQQSNGISEETRTKLSKAGRKGAASRWES